MHIAIVPSTPYLQPENPFHGVFQAHQAETLAARGHQVGVIAPAPRSARILHRRPSASTQDSSSDVVVVRNQRVLVWPGRFRRVLQGFWLDDAFDLFDQYVRQCGVPDLVHAHGSLFAGLFAARLKQACGIPYLLTEHSSRLASGVVDLPAQTHRAFRESGSRIVVSAYLAERVRRALGEDADPLTVIPNVLDPAFERAPLSAGKHRPAGSTILCVANLVPVKNHRLLLRAFDRAFAASPSVTLRIGGTGPTESAVREQIAAAGLSNRVVMLGPLCREAVLREMQACDALVLASDQETFGVALIEAMACGKPVIAPKGSGPDSIVTPGTGLMFKPQDEDGLVLAMRRVIDGQSWNRMQIRESCLARFGSDAVARQLEEAYASVLVNRHARRATVAANL